MRDADAPTGHQDPRRNLGAAVLQVQQRGGYRGEGFDFFEGDAQSDEAETRAAPGKEGALRGEEVAC